MNTLLLLAVVVGQLALAAAGLALSTLIRQLQVDARRPGALIDRADGRVAMIQPPELEAMERLVAESITSEASAEFQLVPVLVQLACDAPGELVTVAPPGRERRRWITKNLAALEQAWGLATAADQRRRPR